MTSKRPGLAVRPVRATRAGWAMSFMGRPVPGSQALTAASSGAAIQGSTGSSTAAARPRRGAAGRLGDVFQGEAGAGEPGVDGGFERGGDPGLDGLEHRGELTEERRARWHQELRRSEESR